MKNSSELSKKLRTRQRLQWKFLTRYLPANQLSLDMMFLKLLILPPPTSIPCFWYGLQGENSSNKPLGRAIWEPSTLLDDQDKTPVH